MRSTQRLPSPNSVYASRWPRLVKSDDATRGVRLAVISRTMPERRRECRAFGRCRSIRARDLELSVMGMITRTAARTLLSGIFVYSGYRMLTNADRYAKQAATALPMLPEDPMVAKAQGATMLAAGSTFALGIFPKLSARILALTLLVSTYVGHQFWKLETPEERRPQLIHFLKNLGILGGLLYISSDRRSKQPD